MLMLLNPSSYFIFLFSLIFFACLLICLLIWKVYMVGNYNTFALKMLSEILANFIKLFFYIKKIFQICKITFKKLFHEGRARSSLQKPCISCFLSLFIFYFISFLFQYKFHYFLSHLFFIYIFFYFFHISTIFLSTYDLV